MLLLFLTSYEKKSFPVSKIKTWLKQQKYFSPAKICGSLEPPMLPMFRTLSSNDRLESNTAHYLE